jgi:hypothetical protein
VGIQSRKLPLVFSKAKEKIEKFSTNRLNGAARPLFKSAPGGSYNSEYSVGFVIAFYGVFPGSCHHPG